ncbi:NADH:ubiquinone reductase (Na(+)-transporting) subunit B [bacterium]|jgi:Na+-transporting NADH:ubiquinone oxidoreductase subunit B|nr:NADH:ubiquinone reductase (Na(+)-transporting) subunit B [bacterium]
MKFLLKLLQDQEKLFKKGGKLEKLYPLFEAQYTILFSQKTVSKTRVHIRDFLDTKRYMITVVLALLPCMLFAIYNSGYQAHAAANLSLEHVDIIKTGLQVYIPLLLVTFVVGGFWEVIFSVVRKHEINEGFLVTGMLFPLIMPAGIPLWMVAMGISFGVVIGKEVFGGTGRNFLNPALTGRAFLFFTYPAFMSGDGVWTHMVAAKDKLVDGFSGATPLAVAALSPTGESVSSDLASAGFSVSNMFWGFIPGSMGETSVFCVLIGAAILIITGIGSWRTMLACVVGAVSMSALFNAVASPDSVAMMSVTPIQHLVMGGFAFGAVFMATDPVSSPSQKLSKLIYGFLIGAVAIIIRAVNPAYPEGMMLSILLMNVFAPVIDHFVMNAKLKKRIPNVI